MSTKSPSHPSSPRTSPAPPSPRLSPARLTLYNISQAFIRIRRIRNGKPITSSSGSTPITHPSLSDAMSATKVPMNRKDEFICASGVDVPKLLRACRSTLLDQARIIGANVLVDEQYVMTQYSPPILIHGHCTQVARFHYPPKARRRRSIQSPGQTLQATISQCASLTLHQIQYSANATRSGRRDPGRPVAQDQAISVPGLMTILKRSK